MANLGDILVSLGSDYDPEDFSMANNASVFSDTLSLPSTDDSSSVGSDSSSPNYGSLLGKALTAGGKSLSNRANAAGAAVSTSEARAQREVTLLDTGTQSPLRNFENTVAQHSKNNFEGPDAVNADTLEAQWNQRLATYAGIERSTGVSR